MRTHVALLAWLTMSGCTDAPEPTEQGPEAATGTLKRGAALDGGLTALPPSTLKLPEIPAVEPEAPAATEKGLPDGVQAISFQSLSLLDADVDGLLDLIFNPIGEEGAEATQQQSVAIKTVGNSGGGYAYSCRGGTVHGRFCNRSFVYGLRNPISATFRIISIGIPTRTVGRSFICVC